MHPLSRSGDRVIYYRLPADVDQSFIASANDIVAIVDCIGQDKSCESWQMDIDFSGTASANDIIEVVNLLNGNDAYDPWVYVEIDTQDRTCPCSCGE